MISPTPQHAILCFLLSHRPSPTPSQRRCPDPRMHHLQIWRWLGFGLEWWLAAGRTRVRSGGAAAGAVAACARQQVAGEIEDIKLVRALYLRDYSIFSATG
ncbi:hypothetical protein OsJ_28050 [Oryza sativa Japonica Group]|uniref:Uncharacterized protein n=1 Tax=Oryza sativa subsp. japonica TaxID=39947 RepID=B9G1Y2_ORYSJ|nr:hypothetical protein OsJ_28050 [Oryza sativa Japonica Group]